VLRSLYLALLYLALVVERPGDHAFSGYWQSPFKPIGDALFNTLPGIRLPLWDVLLVLIALAAHMSGATWKRRLRALDLALLTSVLGVVALCLVGVVRGGSPYQMFFQLHAYFEAIVMAWTGFALFRSERGIASLGVTFFVAALTRVGLGLYFYITFVRRYQPYPYPTFMTTHDDSVLFAAVVAMLVSQALNRPRLSTWLAFVPAFPLIMIMIILNQRRVAWVALLASVFTMYAALPRGRLQRKVRRRVLLALPFFIVYVVVGMGHSARIFAPINAFMTMEGRTADESSKSRDLENAGLVVTLRRNPLLGSGFGREYIETDSRYAPGLRRIFPQYRYIPHNSLLGLLAFTGLLGFSLVWVFVPIGVYLAARSYRFARRSRLRSAALTTVAVFVVYGVQCWGDMGFQSLDAAIFVGAALACAGRLSVITGAWATGRRRRPLVAAQAPVPHEGNPSETGDLAAA
jgi:hypothetical protein